MSLSQLILNLVKAAQEAEVSNGASANLVQACHELDTAFSLDSRGGTSFGGENDRTIELRIDGEKVSETTIDIKDLPEYEG